MDGTEDDMLWEDGEIARVDDNDEAAVEEPDIYDDRLTAEQHHNSLARAMMKRSFSASNLESFKKTGSFRSHQIQ